jgi:hypothetical protein
MARDELECKMKKSFGAMSSSPPKQQITSRQVDSPTTPTNDPLVNRSEKTRQYRRSSFSF